MKRLWRAFSAVFSPIFHTRNIIIMSSKRTKHVSVQCFYASGRVRTRDILH